MESGFPSSDVLEAAVVAVLTMHPNGLNTRAIETAVVDYLHLTDEVRRLTRADNRLELGYCLGWARTHAKSKGLIVRVDRSVWRLAKPGHIA